MLKMEAQERLDHKDQLDPPDLVVQLDHLENKASEDQPEPQADLDLVDPQGSVERLELLVNLDVMVNREHLDLKAHRGLGVYGIKT